MDCTLTGEVLREVTGLMLRPAQQLLLQVVLGKHSDWKPEWQQIWVISTIVDALDGGITHIVEPNWGALYRVLWAAAMQ